jgi:hypothetical protein
LRTTTPPTALSVRLRGTHAGFLERAGHFLSMVPSRRHTLRLRRGFDGRRSAVGHYRSQQPRPNWMRGRAFDHCRSIWMDDEMDARGACLGPARITMAHGARHYLVDQGWGGLFTSGDPAIRPPLLGRRQVVMQRLLMPPCAGSNPAAPAIAIYPWFQRHTQSI